MAWSTDKYGCIDFEKFIPNIEVKFNHLDEKFSDLDEDIVYICLTGIDYVIDIGSYPQWVNNEPDYTKPRFLSIDLVYSIHEKSRRTDNITWREVLSTKFYDRNIDSVIKQVVYYCKFARKHPYLLKYLTYWARIKYLVWKNTWSIEEFYKSIRDSEYIWGKKIRW